MLAKLHTATPCMLANTDVMQTVPYIVVLNSGPSAKARAQTRDITIQKMCLKKV